jgi:hypothetical protein
MKARQAFIASFPYVIKGQKRSADFALFKEYRIPAQINFLIKFNWLGFDYEDMMN